ncbi:MAG: FlgD immunoglobulin-like domain containing protein, partial [Dictyoglomus sp.]
NAGTYIIEITAKDEANNTIMKNYTTNITSDLPLSLINITKFSKSFNPKEGPAEIFFNINQPADVKFIVYTLGGTKLYELDLGYLPAGDYQILWEGINWKGEILKNGLYIFQIVAKSEQGEARINRFIGILK